MLMVKIMNTGVPSHYQHHNPLLGGFQSFTFGFGFLCFVVLCFVTKVLLALRKLQGSGRDIFSTVGLFVYAGVGLWIPRTFRKFYVWLSGHEFSEMEYALMTLPIYITGIMYTIIFIYDKSVKDLEDLQFSRSSLSKGGFEFDWGEILPSFSVNPSLLRESAGGIRMTGDVSLATTQSIANPIRALLLIKVIDLTIAAKKVYDTCM
jgi:hypothetical protein